MSQVDWSKAPEGATHFEPECESPASWMKFDGENWFYWPPACVETKWYMTAMIDDDRIAAMIPRPSPWSGEGLPPVGTVCEVVSVEGNAFTGQFRGKRVRIIAHTRHDDTQLAVFRVESGSMRDCDVRYHALVARCFRPIRTPEQIAAEERERAVKNLFKIMVGHDDMKGWAETGYETLAGLIHDAGYRKVTP